MDSGANCSSAKHLADDLSKLSLSEDKEEAPALAAETVEGEGTIQGTGNEIGGGSQLAEQSQEHQFNDGAPGIHQSSEDQHQSEILQMGNLSGIMGQAFQPYMFNNSFQNLASIQPRRAFIITISNIPLDFQWRMLRDMVISIIPTVNVVYSKVISPGIGAIKVRGYANALLCTQTLNGLQIFDNRILSATFAPESGYYPSYLPAFAPSQLQDNSLQTQEPPTLNPSKSPTSPSSLLYSSLPSQKSASQASQYYDTMGQGYSVFAGYPYMVYPPPTASPHQHNQPNNPMQFNGPDMWFHNSIANNYYLPYQSGSFYSDQDSTKYQGRDKSAFGVSGFQSNRIRLTGPITDQQRLYIGNIPFNTKWQDLKDYLRTGGNIYRVEIPEDDSGCSLGFAVATFHTEEDASNALVLFNGSIFNGRELNVQYNKSKRRNQVTVGTDRSGQKIYNGSNEKQYSPDENPVEDQQEGNSHPSLVEAKGSEVNATNVSAGPTITTSKEEGNDPSTASTNLEPKESQ